MVGSVTGSEARAAVVVTGTLHRSHKLIRSFQQQWLTWSARYCHKHKKFWIRTKTAESPRAVDTPTLLRLMTWNEATRRRPRSMLTDVPDGSFSAFLKLANTSLLISQAQDLQTVTNIVYRDVARQKILFGQKCCDAGGGWGGGCSAAIKADGTRITQLFFVTFFFLLISSPFCFFLSLICFFLFLFIAYFSQERVRRSRWCASACMCVQCKRACLSRSACLSASHWLYALVTESVWRVCWPNGVYVCM